MNYSEELLYYFYKTMYLIRVCEESLIEPILSDDILCPCHLYTGEEAIAAGLGASLTDRDYMFGNHRSHGHFLAKGGNIYDLISEIYCRETGCSRGRGGSMHLIAPERGMLGTVPIVAGTISLAIGSALASSIRKEDRVTVVFFGDGATGEGVLYESLNFAALMKLPIVFVCENNYYATHMPIHACRVKNSIHKIAEPFGINNEQIDGNDVLLVYEAGRKAIEKCRSGEGPFFLECLTYRYHGHVGPDDNIQGLHTDIRAKKEIEERLTHDPLRMFERYLTAHVTDSQCVLEDIRREVECNVRDAHDFAKSSPRPDGKDLKHYVFR